MRNCLLLFAIIFLSGCASTYNQVDLAQPTTKLTAGQSILIATPANGSYGGKEYIFSGRLTAIAINAAFAKYSNNIKVSNECKDIKCLKEKETIAKRRYLSWV
jgi:hypothetical protein